MTSQGYIPSAGIIEISEDFRPSGENHPGVRHRVSIAPTHLFRPGDSRRQPSPIPHPGQLFHSLYHSSPKMQQHISQHAPCADPPLLLFRRTYAIILLITSQSKKTKKFFFPLNLFKRKSNIIDETGFKKERRPHGTGSILRNPAERASRRR